MSHARPSLDELRASVQKQRYREIGNWLARRIARPTAVYGTWAAIRLGLTAHQVTVAALAASLGGAVAIGTGSRRDSWRAWHWRIWASGSIMWTVKSRAGVARIAWMESILIT